MRIRSKDHCPSQSSPVMNIGRFRDLRLCETQQMPLQRRTISESPTEITDPKREALADGNELPSGSINRELSIDAPFTTTAKEGPKSGGGTLSGKLSRRLNIEVPEKAVSCGVDHVQEVSIGVVEDGEKSGKQVREQSAEKVISGSEERRRCDSE